VLGLKQAEITEMKIVVIDDDPMVLRFLGEMLKKRRQEISSVRLFEAARAAEESMRADRANLVLVDLNLNGESGVDSIARIAGENLAQMIIAFTVSGEPRDIDHALRAGAHGYLVKGESVDVLVQQIVERAMGGAQPMISPSVLRHMMHRLRTGGGRVVDSMRLTAAERRILDLTSEGRSCKEIAQRLFISVATVYVHNRRILNKLGVESRVAAAAKYRAASK
jgi:two-component system nitrate/nitrite response regulator NarP